MAAQLAALKLPTKLDRGEDVQDSLLTIAKETGVDLALVDRGGNLMADTVAARILRVDEVPCIEEALANGFAHAEVVEESNGVRTFFAAVTIPVSLTESNSAIVLASAPATVIEQTSRQAYQVVFSASILTGIGFAIVISFVLQRVAANVIRISDAADAIADGTRCQELPFSGKGLLAKSFKRMSEQIANKLGELEHRSDQMEAVLSGMAEGVIFVDSNMIVRFANVAAGRILGFSSESAKGRPLQSSLRDESVRRAVQEAIVTNSNIKCEPDSHGLNKGSTAIHASPVPGDPCPGVVVVLYDVTELRRLESLRQDFVANVSHELKTPLSSIKAYAETLREGAINDPRHNISFVERIEEQANRLHELILDLIRLARIESGQHAFEVSDITLDDVVKSCLEDHQANANSSAIHLSVEAPIMRAKVRADEEAVRQILDNLVDNAIKYTPENGSVTIHWEQDNDMVMIQVTDTGIGIAAEDQSRLFERFYRVDKARSRELGGTGLGLSIVKHLALFFGGSVGVRSEKGKGSTFWVKLPLSQQPSSSSDENVIHVPSE